MIKQKYLTRDWAETIRLYSGLLDEEQRLKFIKELAEVEILLACECRTTTFADDLLLDKHLAMIAVENANDVSKPAKSARGLLALAELDKFTEIADFFRETKNVATRQSHIQVISLYLRNGSENHIFELLKILVISNIDLFSKALDFLFELSFESFTTAQRGSILLNLIGKTDQLIIEKVISLFELRSEVKNIKEIFYNLLRHRQIKYAEKLSKFAQVNVDFEIIEIFGNYVEGKENSGTLRIFLNILDNVIGDFDRTQLNILLCRSLNPIVKNLALETGNNIPIPRELALSICRENLKIGNKSSIEFVLLVRKRFKLESVISLQKIIQSLLKEPKFQRIELAYKLAKDYKLKVSYQYLYTLLTSSLIYENLALARLIVLNEFLIEDRQEALHRICCLAFKKSNLNKLAKQILLEDLQDHNIGYQIGKIYTGFISGKINGKIQIQFSLHYDSIETFVKDYRFRPNSIVTFRFITLSEKIESSKIQVVKSISIPQFIQKYWYRDFYLNQIVNFKPTIIREKSAMMQCPEKKVSFLLKIGDVADCYVRNINEYVNYNQDYKVLISSFDQARNTIHCSLKSLKKTMDQATDMKTDFQEKICMLQQKYSK